MIKKIYIIILPTLVISPLFGMQKTISLHDECTIPNQKRCHSVAFYKDKLFIAGTNGVDIYNTTTKTLSNFLNKPTFHIAVHPSSPHLAVSNGTELAIYNTDTQEEIWTNEPIQKWRLASIKFEHKDLTISSNYDGETTLYNATKKTAFEHEKNTLKMSLNPNNSIISKEYSPDKKIIALRNRYGKCSLYNIANKFFYFWETQKYLASAFHPTKKIIALLTPHGTIEYWNYTTRTLIGITKSFYNDASIRKLYSRTQRLNFSQDCKYLAVGLACNCLILPTPTNNLMIQYYLLLKYTDADITKLTLGLLPHILEMHYFNFVELSKT